MRPRAVSVATGRHVLGRGSFRADLRHVEGVGHILKAFSVGVECHLVNFRHRQGPDGRILVIQSFTTMDVLLLSKVFDVDAQNFTTLEYSHLVHKTPWSPTERCLC
jgi:hypothetical protein